MKSDFQTMTMKELKKYVLEHRNDKAAFQALMERIEAQPQQQVYGEVFAEQFSVIVEQQVYKKIEIVKLNLQASATLNKYTMRKRDRSYVSCSRFTYTKRK
ncbi:MAG: hypothetical protein MJK14_07810 [Rivularia sp. ALOHA_DT_140]|nr:hypothetical protein [Rivularia sp. ALOHA_DT_140]